MNLPFHTVLQASRKAWVQTALAALLSLGLGAPSTAWAQTPAESAATATSPAAPAAISPVAPARTADKESAASPYGLRVTWTQGDLVARSTLIILALMSIGSWYLIVAKALEQRRLMQMAHQARSAFSGNASLRSAAESLVKGGPFRVIVDSAMDGVRQHEALSGQVQMADWLSQDIVRSVGNLSVRLQSGMSALATVGSTAPFVGLFGTVWGIYTALITIGVTGQASIDKVAGPVGEALIMTALGLAVAVPAVLGYNWLVRRNRVAMHTVKSFGSDLHTLLLVNVEKAQRAGKTRATEA
ncbi:MAG: biopolymer transporter ExbB [Burkholderiales bacterium PBB4]|nr:MAG: biopolymer transporter ExbB [Burkholderiales bacterium PBB4]